MADPQAPPPRPLFKQNSWSPDILREETWQRQKSNWGTRSLNCSKSVSFDDLEELKACIELGFGFDSPEIDPNSAAPYLHWSLTMLYISISLGTAYQQRRMTPRR